MTRALRLMHGQERRVHARHLPRADPDRRPIPHQDNGVGFDTRHRFPIEEEVDPLIVRRLPIASPLAR